VRLAQPSRVIVAVPVAAAQTAATLRGEVDAVICVAEPRDFHAVGSYYDDFTPVRDEEVRERLAARRAGPV